MATGHFPESMVYTNYPTPPSPSPSGALTTTTKAEQWGGAADFQWHSGDGEIAVNAVTASATRTLVAS